MADDGERRMLFDTRGRRKNVIRVVYAVLALLMGTSLFFVVGPVNIGEIIGNSASTEAAEVFDEQAERLERRLEEEPGKEEQLLIQLTRARINAGNSLVVVEPGELTRETTPEARDEYEQALEAWERYLAAAEEPNPALAQLVASTFFQLAESGAGVREVTESIATAAEAQRISTSARPSVGSYSTLAYYEYYDGDFKAGDAAKRRAVEEAGTKQEEKSVQAQLKELRKQAKEFDERKQQAIEAEQAGRGEGENPFGPGGGLGE
jgi:murein DD-endopeptidase MepM/ murein hydrolase activator NlpD